MMAATMYRPLNTLMEKFTSDWRRSSSTFGWTALNKFSVYKKNEYKIGDEANLGFSHFKCEQDGYKVEGCFSRDDNSGLVSTAQEGGMFGSRKKGTPCKPHTPIPKPTYGGCVQSGKIFRNGETFQNTRIQYKCSHRATDPIDKGRLLAVGEDFVDKGTVYRCFRTAGSVHFLEYGCGLPDSPACHPKPIGSGDEISRGTLGGSLGLAAVN